MRLSNHVIMLCGHFKNGQPAAGEQSPTRCLPFRIARAAEHRDVTSIGLGHIGAARPKTKPMCAGRPARSRG